MRHPVYWRLHVKASDGLQPAHQLPLSTPCDIQYTICAAWHLQIMVLLSHQTSTCSIIHQRFVPLPCHTTRQQQGCDASAGLFLICKPNNQAHAIPQPTRCPLCCDSIAAPRKVVLLCLPVVGRESSDIVEPLGHEGALDMNATAVVLKHRMLQSPTAAMYSGKGAHTRHDAIHTQPPLAGPLSNTPTTYREHG